MTTDNPTPEDAARAALAQALQGRTASTRDILDLDVSQFVVGDAVHASRVAAWVEENSKPKPTGDVPRRFQPQPESGSDVGTEEAESRFGTKH